MHLYQVIPYYQNHSTLEVRKMTNQLRDVMLTLTAQNGDISW